MALASGRPTDGDNRDAHAALLESERRFRLLIEGVVDYAIYMLDPSGIVTNWNAGAERLKGYRADEIVGQHFSRFYTPEDRGAKLPQRVLEAAAHDGRFEAEGWQVRKDGSRFWASVVVNTIHDETGTLIGFTKVTRDITERHAAQDALRESERQFRLLVKSVTDYAVFMLDPSGVITSWNAGAERIKGYGADEIIGQHFSRFYTKQDRATGLPVRALEVAIAEGRFEAEGWRVRKDGTQFWANVVIDPIRDTDGTLVGFAKVTRDITERRNAQLRLLEMQAQRDQAQKMEALGHLTGGVAHDFNNLLMIVSGHLYPLRRLLADNAAGTNAIDAIEMAARRGESLTRQLLTFARRQTLDPVAVSITDHFAPLDTLLKSSVGGAVKLVADLPSDLWPVRIDVSELDLALVNLALNARDAMPQGGVISVTAANVTLAGPDAPGGLAGDFVALTVSDTGCGIAPDVLPRVFDPFFTTKGAKGSGLGLSQVHGFAHQSGGTVTVRSVPNDGTHITLFLPRAVETPDLPHPAETPAETTATGGSVLLVEDNPAVATATVGMLQQLGYEVVTKSDAQSALDEADRRKFHLVISDIVMAGAMDGLALSRVLRQRHPTLPVVLVTGYSDAARSVERDMVLLRKPFRLEEFSRVVARAIAGTAQTATGNLVRLRAAPRGPTSADGRP
ncbi:MAG TPA: PAS domain S-box protein [Stellaceae bacterium]|nr:PAS domain S-box protein [Stellaceae bacterium]